MRSLLDAIARLSWQRKVAIGLVLLLVALTWLAVCLILASYFPL